MIGLGRKEVRRIMGFWDKFITDVSNQLRGLGMTEWERQQDQMDRDMQMKFGTSKKDSQVNPTYHKAEWSGMTVDRLDEIEVQPVGVRIAVAKHSSNPAMRARARESLRGVSIDSGTRKELGLTSTEDRISALERELAELKKNR